MTTYDDHLAALSALRNGTAVTPECVDDVSSAQQTLREIAEELSGPIAAAMPEPPTRWRSDAATAYAEALEEARGSLVVVARVMTQAEGALGSCAVTLRARLDDLEAALAWRPSS